MRRTLSLLPVLLLLSLPMRVQAQAITITLNPPSGPPGTRITVRGTGYDANSSVFVGVTYWHEGRIRCGSFVGGDYSTFVEARTNSQGTFSMEYVATRRGVDNLGIGFSIGLSETQQAEACFLFDHAESRGFPETGFSVSGRFYDFWLYNGALPRYGYPVTAARDERNYDTGKTYLTQWFERNRFEAHPENRAPYDVLLGRLGAERLLQTGRDWKAEGREAGPLPSCLWFEETGHNVCNQVTEANDAIHGFSDMWQWFGLELDSASYVNPSESLALWGLPLTRARMERNSSGDTVVTQWFERARMEWHPTGANQGRVLLGLLGREVAGLP